MVEFWHRTAPAITAKKKRHKQRRLLAQFAPHFTYFRNVLLILAAICERSMLNPDTNCLNKKITEGVHQEDKLPQLLVTELSGGYRHGQDPG